MRITARASSTSRSSPTTSTTTVDALRAPGVPFQDAPDTYYEMLDARLPGHGEDLERAAGARHPDRRRADRGRAACCCRSSPQTVIGPIFFEIIQRKGNEGFGEGNFKALFESIERDQMRRGVLKA